MNRKKRLRASQYDRHIQDLFDKFAEETGDRDIVAFVQWAEANGEFQPSMNRVRKQFARDVARSLSKDIFEDENGEPIRRRHAYYAKSQKTLWKVIDDMSPDEMRMSYQMTRRRCGGEVFQKQRAIDWYNKHINPGEPIETSWDYDADRKDQAMPTEYPESPPESDQE